MLALGLLFAAGIVAAALDLRLGFEGKPRRVEPNSLLVLDPASGATKDNMTLGAPPTALRLFRDPFGDGVEINEGGKVWRFDARTFAQSPAPPSRAPLAILPACRNPILLLEQENTSWYACHDPNPLLRIANATGNGVPVGGVRVSPSAAAYGAGRVWAVEKDQNELVAINPFTAKVVSRTVVGTDPVAVAVGLGAVWVANAGNGSVTRVDLSNGKVEAIGLNYVPDRIAAGAGAVWVMSRSGKTVIRIDPKKREVTKTIRLANPPVDVAAGAGRVWVAIGH